MTIASSNQPKIQIRVTKKRYGFHISSSTSKKARPTSAYIKNYFSSDSNQKHATPTLIPQLWLKPKQLAVSKSRVSSQSRNSKALSPFWYS